MYIYTRVVNNAVHGAGSKQERERERERERESERERVLITESVRKKVEFRG